MRKSLSLMLVAMLVACGDAETGSQAGSSTTASSSVSGSGGGGTGGAGSGGGGTGGSAVMPVAGEASATPSCAPDDGPAYTIDLGLPERSCVSKPAGPFLRLTFYTHVASPAGNTWDMAIPAGEAQGIYQPDGDPSNIIVVKSGALSVTAWDTASAKGSYDVILNDGTHLAGSFDAIVCPGDPPLCG